MQLSSREGWSNKLAHVRLIPHHPPSFCKKWESRKSDAASDWAHCRRGLLSVSSLCCHLLTNCLLIYCFSGPTSYDTVTSPTFNLWLGTTLQIEIIKRGKDGGTGTDRFIGQHTKVPMSMCQQHAGTGCLLRREMFQELERRGLVPKLFVFKAKLFEKSSTENPYALKKKRHNVFYSQSFSESQQLLSFSHL